LARAKERGMNVVDDPIRKGGITIISPYRMSVIQSNKKLDNIVEFLKECAGERPVRIKCKRVARGMKTRKRNYHFEVFLTELK